MTFYGTREDRLFRPTITKSDNSIMTQQIPTNWIRSVAHWKPGRSFRSKEEEGMKVVLLNLFVLLLSLLDMAGASDGGITATETVTQQRQLARVVVVGVDPPPEDLPLSLCSGDCDNDDEVRRWLVVPFDR
jgi:hypothetical protein